MQTTESIRSTCRIVLALAITGVLAAACSSERGHGGSAVSTPVSPTGLAGAPAGEAPENGATSVDPTATSPTIGPKLKGPGLPVGDPNGPSAIVFPPRNEPFDFRFNTLEAKYRDGLRRPAQLSFVDIEGTIVWTQEYLRYRVNGCDHPDAVNRVFTQIEGRGIAPVCREETGTPNFPPRNEPFQFRQSLEVKYRDELRRPASVTFVDLEGDIVWTQEYLRYRVSSCSHNDAVNKVIDQIDGRGVQPDCAPACSYAVSPSSQTIGVGGGLFDALVTTSPGCAWQASTNVPWASVTSGTTGTGSGPIGYSAQSNPSPGSRSGSLIVNGVTAPSTQVLSLTQLGTPCSYSVSPTSVNVAAGGQNVDLQVTAGAGCTWTAASLSGFITSVSGATGTGNGTARFSVAPASAARTGVVRISGAGFTQDVTISQGGPCSYAVSPTALTVAALGGTFDVQITTGAGCTWNAASLSGFLTGVTIAGTGSGTARFNAAANNVTTPRTGTVRITGTNFSQDVTVSQPAAPPLVASFNMMQGGQVTTACNFPTHNNGTARCTLNAAASSPAASITSYEWSVVVTGAPVTRTGMMVEVPVPGSCFPGPLNTQLPLRITLTVRTAAGQTATTGEIILSIAAAGCGT